MKLATILFNGSPTVAIHNGLDGLVCTQTLDPTLPNQLRELLALGPDVLSRLGTQTSETDADVSEEAAEFLPVIPESHAVWCATLNYATHVEEGNWDKGEYAGWFLRAANSLIGHGQPMIKPTISDKFDYEGELAAVIGRPGHDIDADVALDHIAGYACFNDGSVRDWQRHSTQITPGKNFTASGAFGPYLVTPDEVPDIEQARLVTRLNGRTMQDASVSEMSTPLKELIAYLSTICELRSGDVIVTGTPGGVGARQTPPVFMVDGDVVEVEIDGLGVLRNPVVAATT